MLLEKFSAAPSDAGMSPLQAVVEGEDDVVHSIVEDRDPSKLACDVEQAVFELHPDPNGNGYKRCCRFDSSLLPPPLIAP